VPTVQWPSAIATRAQVWRVLDLSGMTTSVRDSRNFTKAGFVFVDGNQVFDLKTTVPVGTPFTLELRFPNGKIVSQSVTLVPREWSVRTQRSQDQRTFNRKG